MKFANKAYKTSEKVLSVILVFVMLFSIINLIPSNYVSAETQPVSATIVKYYSDWVINTNHYKEMTKAMISPIDNFDVNGISIIPTNSDLSYSYEANNVISSAVGATVEYNDDNRPSMQGITDIIFYIKTEAANSFMPIVDVQNRGDNSYVNYDPQMSLLVGSKFYYSSLSDSDSGKKWTAGTVTTCGKNPDNEYWGTIKFIRSFEGYIKVPIESFGSDTYTNGIVSSDKIVRAACKFRYAGGSKGNVVFAPVFYVTQDSEYSKLLTPETEVIPITDYNVERVGCSGNTLFPINNMNIPGESIDRKLIWDVPYDEFTKPSSCVIKLTDINKPMTGTEGIMFYLSIPSGNAIAFDMELVLPDESRWEYNYDVVLQPYAGMGFSFLRNGETEWQSGQLNNNSTSPYRATMEFDGGFTGYVKIPYSSLKNDTGFAYDVSLDTIKKIVFWCAKVGGGYGEVVIAPLFLIKNDGINDEIIISDKYLEAEKSEVICVENYSTTCKGINCDSSTSDVVFGVNSHSITAAEEWDTADDSVGTSNSKQMYISGFSKKLTDTDGVLMYVKLPYANTISCYLDLLLPEDTARWNHTTYAPIMSLYNNRNYYVLEKGSSEWVEKKVVQASSNNYWGGLKFDTAFEGYIKIPYSSFACDETKFVFDSNLDTMTALMVRFKNGGGSYGNIEIIPAMLYRGVGTSFSFYRERKIMVESSSHGSIEVDKSVANQGERVSATVTPDSGYYLKADGLRAVYTDFGTEKSVIISESATNDGKAFYFEIPKYVGNGAVTIKAEFVDLTNKNFGLLQTVAENDNSLRFTLRNYSQNTSDFSIGMLITLTDALGSNQLDHSVSGIDVIDAAKLKADNGSASDELSYKYNDYTLIFDNIKEENLDKFYTVRGYSVSYENGIAEYSYTDPISVSYSTCKNNTLPEMETFGEDTDISKDYRIKLSYVDSPISEITSQKATSVSATDGCDTDCLTVQNSVYWFSKHYSPVNINNYSHIAIYLKVPETKDNYLYLQVADSKGTEYKFLSNGEYSLLSKGGNHIERANILEGSNRNWGVLRIPAGFEGLIVFPIENLDPLSSIKPDTEITKVTYRFSYIGDGYDSVTVGSVFGVIQHERNKNNYGKIISALPSVSTSLSINESKTEMTDNSAILYWEEKTGAENYCLEAYRKVIGGYICESKATLYSNSGALTGLTENKEYTVFVTARDSRDNVLGIYKPISFVYKENAEISKDITEDDIIYDDVDYSKGNIKGSAFVDRDYTALNASNSELLNMNPNRGLRGIVEIYHFDVSEEELKAKLDSAFKRGESQGVDFGTYLCYIYPGDYIDTVNGDLINLPEQFFKSLQYIFDYFRENKTQVIMRFAYYDVNNFNKRTPTTEEILNHISNLSDNGIIERNKDILNVLQVGFVGKYGEWHSNTTEVDTSSVIASFAEKLLPNGVYSQVRMPQYKNLLPDTNTKKKMFGFNIDSFFGIMDGTELGSGEYSYGHEQWNQNVTEGAYTPNDAELYYWGQFIDMGIYSEGYGSAIAAAQLRLTTFSGINGYLDQSIYAAGCMNEWKKLPVTQNWLTENNLPFSNNWFKNNNGDVVKRNVYEYIRDYLGYRFSVTNLKTVKDNDGMRVNINLINYGFSAGFNLSSELVLLDGNNNIVEKISIDDPEKWYGTAPNSAPDGNLISYTISGFSKLPEASGEYKIALALKTDLGACARLDNNIPFVSGYNILHSFII